MKNTTKFKCCLDYTYGMHILKCPSIKKINNKRKQESVKIIQVANVE